MVIAVNTGNWQPIPAKGQDVRQWCYHVIVPHCDIFLCSWGRSMWDQVQEGVRIGHPLLPQARPFPEQIHQSATPVTSLFNSPHPRSALPFPPSYTLSTRAGSSGSAGTSRKALAFPTMFPAAYCFQADRASLRGAPTMPSLDRFGP